MSHPFYSLGTAALALLALVPLVRAPAQEAPSAAEVVGTVVETGSGAPIADVTVVVEGSRMGALTDAQGRYRIVGVPLGAHVLVARRVGLATARQPVSMAAATVVVDFALSEAPALIAPVVVSATREAQERGATSSRIDVLSGDEVREARASHPSGVLNRVAGVYVSALSGEGHSTAIRQPITTKPMYLFLEDGIPTRSTGFFNHNALYEVNIPQSGGVEVLKGPGTALYGSDAIGGVVNVLTRPAPAKPTVEATVEGGAAGYGRILASGGFLGGRDALRADLNFTRNDGWRDDSRYTRQSGTVRWERGLAAGLSLKTVLTASNIDQRELLSLDKTAFESRPQTNLSPLAFRRVKAVRFSSALERDAERSHLSITPYARYDALEILPTWQLSFDPQLWDTRNSSAGLLVKYRRDLAPLRARIIVGADADYSPGSHTADSIATTRDGATYAGYTVVRRDYDYEVTYRAISPYVHAELSPLSRLRLDAGLRYDASGYAYDTKLPPVAVGRHRRPADTTVAYHHLSPKVGATLDLGAGANLFASYRHGFRAPAQSQLFAQGATASTVSLHPVSANSFEVGVRGDVRGRVLYQLSAYDMRIENDILTTIDQSGVRLASNAGATRHRGVELGLALAPHPALRVDASWSLSRQEYEEWVAPVGGRLVSYAGRSIEAAPSSLGNMIVGWTPSVLNGGRLAIEWSSVGRYWMDPENTHRYGGHDVLSVHLSYHLRRSLELFGRLSNVADRRYAVLAAYNAFQREQFTPGAPRQLFVGARYDWER
jgi:outer membrane receptor protein involved in Fe transport